MSLRRCFLQSSVLKKNHVSNCCVLYRNKSLWSEVPMAPPDGIFGLMETFKHDDSPKKVNLSVGVYRDDQGLPYVLPCVRKAEKRILEKVFDKEYNFIAGSEEFCRHTFNLIFGDDNEISKNGLTATVQTLAGSGALSLVGMFLKKIYPGKKEIYLPTPTWVNHYSIFNNSGLEVKAYRYYDRNTMGLDFDGMLQDIDNMQELSVILFHACAHNPTGFDPSREQWSELAERIKKKNLFIIFDFAYQGFASGNQDDDAFAVREFACNKINMAVAQSYSKNLGLYGDRTGTLSILAETKEEVARILSQLKVIIRSIYSNPPIHGFRIVNEIFSDPQLKKQWMEELKAMANRIVSVRKQLHDSLIREGSTHNWDHIINQIGMFCYTGLKPEQVEKLVKVHKVYLTKDGRISMAGICSKNVQYVAQAIHDVTKC